jgi:hypothetical protein
MKMKFMGSMFAVLFFLTSLPAWALPEIKSDRPTDTAFMGDAADKADEIQVLEAKDILLLDDQKLVEAYIDAIVEIDATKTFHSTSGFTPKEFKAYKGLLKYRLHLLFEIHRRKMEIPAEVK